MNPAATINAPAYHEKFQAIQGRFRTYAITFGVIVAIVLPGQLLMGTDPSFTGLVIAYTAIWLLGIWLVGGPATILGACVGLTGFQHVVFAQIMKVMFWQRPDIALLVPTETMTVNVLGIAGITAACALTRLPAISRLTPVLAPDISIERLKVLAYVFTAFMMLQYLAVGQFASVLGVFKQFEFVPHVAAAVTTAYVVRKTEGRRMIGLLNGICILVPVLYGIAFGARKESAFALIVVGLTAFMFGFRFKWWHFAGGIAVGYFMLAIMFPYALYARHEVREQGLLTGAASKAGDLFLDVLANPERYRELNEEITLRQESYETQRLRYYGDNLPTIDRYSIIPTVDALIASSMQNGPHGPKTIYAGFEMVIPRAFNPDKNPIGTSNYIARTAPGLVTDVDFATSITMGFVAESFFVGWWVAVFPLCFLMTLCYVVVYRIVISGDMFYNVWACALSIYIAWPFSEGSFQQSIIMVFQNGLLIAGTGLFFLIVANSLIRGRKMRREQYRDLPEYQTMVRRL